MSNLSTATSVPPLRPSLGVPGLAALGIAGLGFVALGLGYDWRIAALFAVGGALGLVLYHAAFGFTAGWRNFIRDGRGRGLRAQMVLLALTVALFFPPLAAGTLWGTPVSGFVSPIGVSVIVGAFMFGIGMQLGGGCASGTLYTAGGGNARMLITLAFFVIGSVLATVNFDWWMALPAFEPVSLATTFGPWAGIAISWAIFAAIALVTVVLERKRHGGLEVAAAPKRSGFARFARGPWPLVAGAVALALLNFLTLWLAGRPWGITSGFALWGAKGAQMIGFEPSTWAYWQAPGRAASLSQSVFTDITSVMNFGIILGALLASALAGRFAPNFRIPGRSVFAAALGGILLGYGARIAFGCNIGAYFSGIASGSLHGWVWMVAAYAGSIVGVKLRPIFFVDERPHITKTA